MYNNGIRIADYNGLVSDISMMLTNTGASGDAVGQQQIMGLLSPYINTFKAWSLLDPEKTKSLAAIIKPYVTEEQLKALGLPTAFNTGGYTGSWDSSGRLAVLHEKELVLNKEDTKNILESVSIVRTIASALEGLSNNRIVQMMSGFETSMAAWDVAKEMVIEQKVDITAEFPNATDKDEIMEAFDNLINLASQHAYKTTR